MKILLMLIVAVALVAAGCSNDNGTSNGAANSSTNPATGGTNVTK